MGQSQSTIHAGERLIKIKNVKQRLDKETLVKLKSEFDRISEAGTINNLAFISECIGWLIPDQISNHIYRMFASPTLGVQELEPASLRPQDKQQGFNTSGKLPLLKNYVMTFDDFCAFYVTFEQQRDEEVSQMAFAMIQLNPHHCSNCSFEDQQSFQTQVQNGKTSTDPTEVIAKSDIAWWVRTLQLPERSIREFFLITNFSPNFPVQRGDFQEQWHKVKHLPVFTWILTIISGYLQENMNLETEHEAKGYERRLSVQQRERQQLIVAGSAASEDGPDESDRQSGSHLSQGEIHNITEFYNSEIKNKPAQEVHQIFRRMLKDMKNNKLRKYIFSQVSQVAGLSFIYLVEMCLFICKEPPKERRLKFLFNLFSKQGKTLRSKDIKNFIEIFRLPMQVFKLATFLSLEQFLDELDGVDIDFSALLAARPMMIAMTAVTPETDEEEREAILAAMNGHKNLETFIYETLPDEQEYFVIEKDFWESWCTALAITQDGKYLIKKEHKDFIDNKKLMMEMHQFRMKDLTYKQDFVLLPKYVYHPLSKWYSCEKEITRTVIQYRREKKFGGMQESMYSSQQSKRFLMSSQKFYNPNEGQFEEELVHKKGEFVYELEIYPVMFYLAMVTEKGEKLHKKAVNNGIVDFNYIRKVAKTDNLPFEELQVSRKTSLHHVLQLAAQTFSQNIKRGRLLIEDSVVSGTTLYKTLEEYGLRQGQLVYAEFCNSSSEYPTDLVKEKSKPHKKITAQTSITTSTGEVVSCGTTSGLQNLGNTCYMNSAIQVLSNLKILHEYFVQEKLYFKQTNIRNPLGFQGVFVTSFAHLQQRLWNDNRSITPRFFKQVLANSCEQFMGFDQQDAQEFMAFCIDGLHEELNLRMKKPYIKNPESKNRDLNELGLEQWSNSLLRNWSVIYFLFYGQMKSTISCRSCRTDSTTFDIFSNTPLSLPEPTQQTVSIIVYRVPNRTKDILHSKIVKDDAGNVTLQGFHRVDSNTERDSESGSFAMSNANPGGTLQRMHSSQSNRDRQHLAQFAESYNYMNNDQPMRVCIKVDNDIKIADLITKISQIRELNIELPMVKTELVLYQLTDRNNIKGVMMPHLKLSQYTNVNMDLMASEVVTREGKAVIKKFYMDNDMFYINHPETSFRCLMYASEKGDPIDGIQGYPMPHNLNTPAVKGMFNSQAVMSISQNTQQNNMQQRPITGESEYDSESYYSSNMSNIRGIRPPRQKMDKYLVLTQCFNHAFQYGDIEQRIELPRDILVVAYHRRFVKRQEPIFAKYHPQLIGQPCIFIMPTVPSGRRIYDEIWATAHVLLKTTSRFFRGPNRWWERKNWRDLVKSGKGIYAPFALKAVDETGYACALCHWMKRCSGCLILPTDAPIFEEDFIKKCFIAIEWHSKQLADNYNTIASEVVEHASCKKRNNEMTDQANYSTLEDCLTKFHKTEQLENEVTCERCKSPQLHMKRMEVFIPPPVLIIQLKRFRLYGNQWRKLQNLIDFPLRNFDISSFCSDPKFLKEQLQIDPVYNLHGIVNHYGSLGFGHYVSFVKNQFDEKWYRYDDMTREEVSESELHKESAYMLFYLRQDMINKNLEDLMPNIQKDYFAGKPVKLNGEDGFVLENPTKGGAKNIKIKLKNGTESQTVSTDELDAEEDKHEIEYTKQEIAVMKKRDTKFASDELPQQQAAPQTKSCCCIGGGSRKEKVELSNDTDKMRRRNSVKQAGIISQMKKIPNQQSQKQQPKQITRQQLDADSSVASSSVQPLIGANKSPTHSTAVAGVPRTVSLQSPKVMVSARQNIGQRHFNLENQNEPGQGRSVIQSQEGALNVVPRPRFKINDGMGDQVESIMSHFSQSDINHETEGQEVAQAAHGTVSILNSKGAARIPQSGRNGQHSSQMDLPRAANLTQQV